MKFNLRKRKKYLIAGGLLLATATPSFAIFGIGDIVFDPTSYASLVSQLTTLDTQYNMLKNNITHFSFKQQWQTTLSALKNANVANMFGETAGFSIALNTKLTQHLDDGLEDSQHTGQQHDNQLPPGSDGWEQRTAFPTRHGRDVGFDLPGLPHGSWAISDSS